jgi:hypothetical protein
MKQVQMDPEVSEPCVLRVHNGEAMKRSLTENFEIGEN